jgi:hypothetical protein
MMQVYVTFPPQLRQRKSVVRVYLVDSNKDEEALALVRKIVCERFHVQTYGEPSSFECFPVDSKVYQVKSFLKDPAKGKI